MKGLIINDLLSMRKMLKTMVVITAFFAIIWAMNDQPQTGLVMLGTIAVSWLLNLFSYDEFYHWDNYVSILPVSKKQIVLARYLVFGIVMLVSIAFSFVYLAVLGCLNMEGISAIVGMVVLELYTTIVIIPTCYKLGVQKGRMIYIILMLIPFVGILGFFSLWGIHGVKISQEIMTAAAFVVPIILLLCVLVSIKLSISFVTKRSME